MSEPDRRWMRWAWRAICLAVCASATLASAAAAQSPGPRLLVLRNDVTATELSTVVDRALDAALTKHARFASTYVSPTPFAEIQLAAGCQGRANECVERIATTLDADWLLVRELRRDGAGRVVLELVAQDGATASTRRAQARVARDGSPERVVAQLVSELYASSDVAPVAPVASTVPHSDDVPKARTPARAIGLTLLASSAALLTSGAVLGVVGKKDEDRYARTDVVDAQSADHAQSALDDARRRTHLANVLLATGAVTALTGASVLLWRHTRLKRDARLSLAAMAGPRVAVLELRGTFGGAP
jgi:hypothetical protein